MLLTIGLSGCAGNLSALDPAGPAAQSSATLWWVMAIGGTAIFIFVMVLLAVAFMRPGIGRDVDPKRWLVWGGLVFPGTVLSALLVFALLTGERLLAHPQTPGVVQVEARPHQWFWQFRYPGAETATNDVLHIPAGVPVDVHVVGTDVIHSFWVPRLAGKIDAIPGHINVIRLVADRPGTYGGVCAEFCGIGHVAMSFSVVAHPAGDYDAALSEALASPRTETQDQP
ncbi:MAG TPA: cytochrome c oxidase subunit II [Aurantimonas sp.]|jgi:cytochrome c oxidase subunit 2|nr:cytochrome c oxidase subunit II [Aurantimonas sp.]